jgi:serine/threonine-protein kinase
MDLKAGTAVTPSVTLLEPLDQGGMGAVWIAQHSGLDTRVAVKFIASDLPKNHPELVARFKREARAASRIKSPHVVQTFDHGSMPDGTPFIVMELLEGSSMADWMDLVGRMAAGDVAKLVQQLAGVLGKAHKLGIVHRDIKPANIFVVDSGSDELFVKLLDFGVAKQAGLGNSVVTRSGAMVGTPDYMSPEQVMDAKDVDHQADLWALSVVAYEALCGHRPFTGDTLGQLVVALNEGAFEPLSRRLPRGCPKALDGWFARALARDKSHRFGTARELALSFRAASGGGATAPSMPSAADLSEPF